LDLCGFCIEEWEKLFLSYIAMLFAERHKRPTILILIFFAANAPLDCVFDMGVLKYMFYAPNLEQKNKQINK